ncbi:hypothetical protein QBC37DRAFT_372826 [Rhypophila decipiens]|uniref:Uncharacterized protein n=1 Tax=Rhypophila decipiens TaxID=261697 RepID=A0AAN6YAW0_9PEZI|nr:hypothetical protein QBC37DRAFT_372826 [Rhypophila decipiens]
MKTTQDNYQQILAGPPSPVTPEGRGAHAQSPPGAPRRFTTRRPLLHRHDGSCCFQKSPQMHPSEFERLLRASAGIGPAPSGTAVATGTLVVEADTDMRLAVPSSFDPSGFVIGFTGEDDDPFAALSVGPSQPRDGTAPPVTVTDARDEINPTAGKDMPHSAKERMAKFLGLVAAAVVVAADVLATVSEGRDATSTTPAVPTAPEDGDEDI